MPRPAVRPPAAARRLGLALALALAALLAAAPAAAQDGAPEGAGSRAAAWRHGRLTVAEVGGRLVASWTTADERLLAQGGVLPLAERLLGRLVLDTEDAWVALLDGLGARGWELVASSVGPDGRRDLWFRRPLDPAPP